MKRTTLSALCAAAMLFGISYTHAQTYAQFASTPTSEVSDDGGGQIGIGTSSPSAKLHVNGATGSNPIIRVSNTFNSPDYFVGQTSVLVSGTVPPTYSTQTRFVVSNMGYIGIGEAAPQAALDIIDKRAYLTTGDPLIDRRMIAMRDKDDNDLMYVANTGTGSTHGACLLIRAEPDFPGLVVWDGLTNARFAVAGDGSVCLGLDLSEQPEAQLDIRTITGRDYMVNVANPANTLPHFNVHSSGNIGIGLAATSSTAKLSVRGSIDMYYNSTVAPALRLATSGGVARHVITDADDNLVIDPGVGGGANDKLVIDGRLAVTQSGTGDVYIDLVENVTDGWNAQMRIIGTDGNPKHVITEVDNELYIDPGFNGNATDKVKIAGNLETTGKVQIGTTAPTGTYSSYMLGVDGDIVAKKVIVQIGSWADKVFENGYNLRSLAEVENYIAQNGHLPEVPSECEVLENGIEVGEMNKLLLQKVEELTLHVIALQKQIDLLNKK